jgi:hypothetical protein
MQCQYRNPVVKGRSEMPVQLLRDKGKEINDNTIIQWRGERMNCWYNSPNSTRHVASDLQFQHALLKTILVISFVTPMLRECYFFYIVVMKKITSLSIREISKKKYTFNVI